MRTFASALTSCAPALNNSVLQPTTIAATPMAVARRAPLKIRVTLYSSQPEKWYHTRIPPKISQTTIEFRIPLLSSDT